MSLSNLSKRLMFALWAAPVGWWVVNSDLNALSHWQGTLFPGQILAVILLLLACFEYTRMLATSFPTNGFWLMYLWIIAQAVLYFRNDAPPSGLSIYAIYVLLIMVAAEAIMWGGRDAGRWKRASLLFSGTVFLYVAGVSMLNFYQHPFQSLFVSYPGRWGMLSQMGIVTVLTSIFLCDTAAYFIGSLWGKHHFSSISPRKTMEGSVAGLVTAVVVASTGWYFFRSPGYPLALGPVIGLIIGVFAQLGDLLVSLMKRSFQVKDASDMIPGHGGILDRFDSLFFTAPTLVLFFWGVSKVAGLWQ